MNRLLDIGFEPVGHWLLQNGKLVYELTRHATERNILYAFICDGQIKYIGKSTRTLSERLTNYKNPDSTQSTNIKNNKLLTEAISGGVAVEIFALPDRGLIHYGAFHLNLAAALEDDIIRVIGPEWNGARPLTTAARSIETTKEAFVPDRVGVPESTNSQVPPIPVLHKFRFTLQPTYKKSGFFNVGVDSERYIGADGEKIEMFLGDASQPTQGSINRRANTNGTPRVTGGTKLRDWFQTSASLMQSIEVQVMSPTSLRLVV